MTTSPQAPPAPEPPPDPQARPRPSLEELRDLSRLRRTIRSSPEGRHIAGVAGGIARHFDIDPLVVRVVLVVAIFFGPAVILYAAGWLLLPEEGSDDGVLPVDTRTRIALLWAAGGIAALTLAANLFGGRDLPWIWVGVGIAALAFYGSKGKWALWHHGMSNGAGGRWLAWPSTGDAADGRGGAAGPVDLSKDAPAAAAAPADAEAMARLHGYLNGDDGTAVASGWRPPAAPERPRRGPRLTGTALATAALLSGVLGLVHATGTHVPGSAYPALVLAVFASFLVVGAFWGRATGLIALSFIPLIALAATTAGDRLDIQGENLSLQPHSAAALEPEYRFDVGKVLIDLSKIPAAQLDGRRLDIDGDVGQIVVIVPDDVKVTADGIVSGPGEAWVLGDRKSDIGGAEVARTGGDGTSAMTLDATVDVGSVMVISENDHRASSWLRRIGQDVQRGVDR